MFFQTKEQFTSANLYRDPNQSIQGVGSVFRDNHPSRNWGWCEPGKMLVSFEGFLETSDSEEFVVESVAFALFRFDEKMRKKWKKPKKMQLSFQVQGPHLKKKDKLDLRVSAFDYPLDWIKNEKEEPDLFVPNTLCPIAAQILSGAIVAPTLVQTVSGNQELSYDVLASYQAVWADLTAHSIPTQKEKEYLLGFAFQASATEVSAEEKMGIEILPETFLLSLE